MGSHCGTIHLANPDESRTPGPDGEPIVGQTRTSFSVERERTIAEGMRERIRIVNYAAHVETIEVELDIASDAADIFEVRGYPRGGRGELLPVLIEDDRVTFRYVGRDGLTRTTWLAFSGDADVSMTPDGAALRLSWRWELRPGTGRELEWTAWSTLTERTRQARGGLAAERLGRGRRRGTPRLGERHDARSRRITRCSTGSSREASPTCACS